MNFHPSCLSACSYLAIHWDFVTTYLYMIACTLIKWLFDRVNRAPLLSHLERKFSDIHPWCDRLQKWVLRGVVCVHAQAIHRFSFSCACSSQSVMAPSILWDRMYWLLESAAGLNLQVENSIIFILLWFCTFFLAVCLGDKLSEDSEGVDLV